jgi:hypothetical protein
MIYVKRISKYTGLEKTLRMNISDAKMFIYDLDRNKQKYSTYILAGTDTIEELNELKEYFSDKVFEKVDDNIFEVYKMLENVRKQDKLKNVKITPTTINNIIEKIKNEVPELVQTFLLTTNGFNLFAKFGERLLIVKLNYNLEIEDFAVEKNLELENDIPKEIIEAKRKINGILSKQRYYYKNK